MKKSYNLVKIMFNRLFVYVISLTRKRISRKEKMIEQHEALIKDEFEELKKCIKATKDKQNFDYTRLDNIQERLKRLRSSFSKSGQQLCSTFADNGTVTTMILSS